jgi:hypothetical protein
MSEKVEKENADTKDVAHCIWKLSGVLMNDKLDADDAYDVIVTIDKLNAMLARWYLIR